MSYYIENRNEILKKSYDRYHNRGGKEKSAKYYRKNADLFSFEANMKYRNMSKKEKDKKKESTKAKDIMTQDIMNISKNINKFMIV